MNPDFDDSEVVEPMQTINCCFCSKLLVEDESCKCPDTMALIEGDLEMDAKRDDYDSEC